MAENKIKTHHLDASGETPGRLATKISTLLIGKHKASYVPYKECGDRVIVSNVDKMKIWPNKLTQKKYFHYSNYPGGMKSKLMGEVFIKEPQKVLLRAVSHMLPKNKLRKPMLKRLAFEIKK
ncbi:MAG: 50S ribosomal protein L13 [Patescibacteria group bacterium]|nr:50S ribosomal protein L13 [Patescibacteria group bacterium]MDD5121389.1 50S ribosomal protein L13 [Patescibacteria group bacterium]MDD5221796.1 50S ribosomal protein L13 [Patescibacteria group bacterium]MDD5395692.1 50S ribosomal protein L13 [Patescibacteria group bacterium]